MQSGHFCSGFQVFLNRISSNVLFFEVIMSLAMREMQEVEGGVTVWGVSAPLNDNDRFTEQMRQRAIHQE